MRRLTTDMFISKVKKIHNDFYDYSKVDYLNNTTKIIIGCPKHGYFEQTPNMHKDRGQGCPECSNNIRLTTKKFIARATEIHGQLYNYNDTIYDNMKAEVEIECVIHGKFIQKADVHLSGHGCQKCSLDNRIKKCLIDYGCSNPAQSHLNTENLSALTKKYIEENYLDAENHLQVVELMKFVGWKTDKSVYDICSKLNVDWDQGDGGFNVDKSAILYYLIDRETGLYKIGITNFTPKHRFGNIIGTRAHILMEKYYEIGLHAYQEEQRILIKFAKNRVINHSWPSNLNGKTEFFNCDILDKD